ncbi:bifunctional methylenetetrahydrofolate dehydrogenase/methenyltetrahydrofolate cyclohydrolase FolD [Helicobacter cappadocius]|uniref:Bifunctional protein FolD n=1 Tax=Helicobacter cappadocius TaxID=3063998 RepID=A0AA90PLL7_9HELI|nr:MULTISPECIES: bifunctional methylenetetrahydrofolate dehydrogenase/methenyltetrahydrofolate cyclohydrolase FolD [unclassified Helicobacter]MDO7253742.1 bifunctional methylenetetrahydrofolate dehydrogenase/methenyltetrahydrofolate cyclohydrolase FolD [Helicobacter sp. faydin-H75]MDP2539670.1 bifunctional methylenetetrahydrofolate dehydrogenase/methenyltetrahydrofolate cyclohydrolase FolD [Helicobacter sp. faydin-H76]
MILLDGKALASTIEKDITNEGSKLRNQGIVPTLAVVLVGEDAASCAYVNMKVKACERVGIKSIAKKMPENVSEEELLKIIEELDKNEEIDGILVQLPLPKHINTKLVLEAISYQKDVDGFHPFNIGRILAGIEAFAPATPLGVMNLLKNYNISVRGKNVAIIGASNIVGKPLASLMLNAGATISVCHILTQDLAFFTRSADIVCVGVGKPDLIQADMIKEGAVVIDIGINRLENGKLVGDVAFESVSKKASFITPVPGGVGPMTIVSLLQNTLLAAKNRKIKN